MGKGENLGLKSSQGWEEEKTKGRITTKGGKKRKPRAEFKNKGGNSITSPNNNPGGCIWQLRVPVSVVSGGRGSCPELWVVGVGFGVGHSSSQREFVVFIVVWLVERPKDKLRNFKNACNATKIFICDDAFIYVITLKSTI